MGHVLLGTLPATRPWKDVVELIADGADLDAVAEATIRASDKAFTLMENDPGFRETVWLLTQLAVAAKQNDPGEHHQSIGLNLSPQTSLVEMAITLGQTLEERVGNSRRTDLGEMAQNALVSSLVEHLNDKLGTLFTPSSSELHSALGSLGTQKQFGALATTFFAKLTHSSLDYFLTKTLATHIGEGQRFTTTSQVSDFQTALELHCREAAQIVTKFSGEWFSKNRFQGEGDISKETTARFGWYAMEKIRSEMRERNKADDDRI